MNIVSSAPYISPVEFETACKEFSESFAAQGENQSAWLSVEYVQSRQGNYLRISKRLRTFSKPKDNLASDEEEIEEEEDDEVCMKI